MLTQKVLLQELKDYSARHKISHQTLAKRLGISFVTLSQWLQGHRKLRPKECVQIEKLIKK